jgi:hypothetical protein
VKETHENGNDFSVDLKIEKPFVENNEDWFEVINVKFDREVFENEVKNVKVDRIIGVKGRLSYSAISKKTIVIGERLQVF